VGLPFMELALYSRTLALPDTEIDRRREFSRATRRVHEYINQFSDAGFQEKYPLLTAVRRQLGKRIAADYEISTRCGQMAAAGDIKQAWQELWFGVRFHAGSDVLLEHLVNLSISRMTIESKNEEFRNDVLHALRVIDQSVPPTSWRRIVAEGRAFFALGDLRRARSRISVATELVKNNPQVLAEVNTLAARIALLDAREIAAADARRRIRHSPEP